MKVDLQDALGVFLINGGTVKTVGASFVMIEHF
jgi:hypothetical protein